MNQEFTFIFTPDGSVTFSAYCLRTDSWHDYLAFIGDAERAIASSDLRNSNRFLRAALASLFSHVEGVVNEIYAQKNIPEVFHGGRLCDRTRNIAQEAKKIGRLPFFTFRFEKHLRDLVAHPGINMFFSEGDGESIILTQDSVFKHLDVSTLKRFEAKLSPWLDIVCRNLGVLRFTDTKRRAERAAELLKELGNVSIHEV